MRIFTEDLKFPGGFSFPLKCGNLFCGVVVYFEVIRAVVCGGNKEKLSVFETDHSPMYIGPAHLHVLDASNESGIL